MCKNGTYEGLGYIVSPDEIKYEYESLYSLKKVAVTTPGKVSFGEWKNGVTTRTFSENEFASVVARELPGVRQFYDYLFNNNMANMEAERKRINKENEAAYGQELMRKMDNVSFSNPSSGSSNSSSGNGTGTSTRVIERRVLNGDGSTTITKQKVND